MLAIVTDVSSMEWVFIVCAALGGCLFVVRMLLMFVSGLGHGDITGAGMGMPAGPGTMSDRAGMRSTTGAARPIRT